MKKILFTLLIIFLFPFVANAQSTVGDKPILYVREGCPHCEKVDAFLEKNNLKNFVIRNETFNNEEKQKELEAWFVKLNVTDVNQKGVPFLVIDDKTYFVGDVDIIKYIAGKNNIVVQEPQYQASTADTIFLAVGGIVLFGVIGYGVYSSFKKKN